MKLNLGKDGILGFIKKSKTARYAVLFIIVGLVLVIAGTVGFGKGRTNDEPASLTEEDRLCRLCSEVDGVGECRVMITFSSDGKRVESAAIVCRGADSVSVRRGLTELVTSLYGIGANGVSLSKMKIA